MIKTLNMNNKTTPNQMRVLLRRMRGEEYIVKEEVVNHPKKDLTMRDMFKITRKLNEEVDKEDVDNKEDNWSVFWGGTVDGIIQFVYKVTPDESTSGVEIDYLVDFSPDNPEHDKIIKKIQSYYDYSFKKYWINNINNETVFDQNIEEKKFKERLNGYSIKFIDLEIKKP